MIHKRILEFDLLRSIAVIWIVAIWHFSNYFSTDTIVGHINSDAFSRQTTFVVLSLFMFLSGLFTKTSFNNAKDIKTYYIKKAKRFYPLYLVAALTLYFTTIPISMTFYSSISQLLLSLLGVSSLLNNAPSTLWFMDMLMFLMIITPILTWKSNIIRRIIVMFVLFALIYVVSKKTDIVDFRFVRYTPFYFIGLLLTPKRFLILSNKYGMHAFLMVFLIMLFKTHNLFIDMIAYACLIMGGGKCTCILSKTIGNAILIRFIGACSYSSMCAYFFHRQIYAIGIKLAIPIWILPIIIFTISYFIQKKYDIIVNTKHE